MDTTSQLLRYAVALVLMVPMLGFALIVGIFSVSTGWRIYRLWNRIALKIFGITVETHFEGGPEQLDGGGTIVSLNQDSLLAPTAAYSAWDTRVLSIWNIEYALIPFFGWASLLVGWIIVRQNPKQAKSQIRKAALHAGNGGIVHLSAEGQRSVDGRLNPYKKGPVVLAIESQAPIHPSYIVGTRDCMPVGEWKIRPGKIVCKFLPSIPTLGLTYEDRNELLQKLREVGETEWRKQNPAQAPVNP